MARKQSVERVAPDEVDALIDRARAENWHEFVLLGPSIRFDDSASNSPGEPPLCELTGHVEGLAGKLRELPNLTLLDIPGNHIGDDGAETIAAALPALTTLDLGRNEIGLRGLKAISYKLPGLIYLSLWAIMSAKSAPK